MIEGKAKDRVRRRVKSWDALISRTCNMAVKKALHFLQVVRWHGKGKLKQRRRGYTHWLAPILIPVTLLSSQIHLSMCRILVHPFRTHAPCYALVVAVPLSKGTRRLTACFMTSSALRRMATQHHIPFYILPSNEPFQQLACLRTSVKGVSQPDINCTTLTAYLSISGGKRPPLSPD
jgi:hypothetical protein